MVLGIRYIPLAYHTAPIPNPRMKMKGPCAGVKENPPGLRVWHFCGGLERSKVRGGCGGEESRGAVDVGFVWRRKTEDWRDGGGYP